MSRRDTFDKINIIMKKKLNSGECACIERYFLGLDWDKYDTYKKRKANMPRMYKSILRSVPFGAECIGKCKKE